MEFGDVNEEGLEVDKVRNNSSLHLGVGAGAKQEVERKLEEAGLETCPGFGRKGKGIPRKAFTLVFGSCKDFARRQPGAFLPG